tara:strand:- start:3145 stop:3477 length:333 start_codon:yes stop_codon:yes gene_type:complete
MMVEITEEKRKTEEKKTGENIMFIGGKPFMNYVMGVVMQFNKSNVSEVIIKSRGKFISKAVDVAEVSRKKFLSDKDIIVGEIKIGSEEFENKEGKTISVSVLEITLKRII